MESLADIMYWIGAATGYLAAKTDWLPSWAWKKLTTQQPPSVAGGEGGAASSIEKIIAIGQSLSDEEIAGIPTDGAHNVDHYVYGTPKRAALGGENDGR